MPIPVGELGHQSLRAVWALALLHPMCLSVCWVVLMGPMYLLVFGPEWSIGRAVLVLCAGLQELMFLSRQQNARVLLH